jgi:hypothetical protein
MKTEIYYLLCYDVVNKKWHSADHMLSALTNGDGQVLAGDGETGKFRQLEDGIEMDIDYDNTSLLGKFLREANGIS